MLQTPQGDTIPTGVPYLLAGQRISSDTLPPPVSVDTSTYIIPAKQPKKYPVERVKVTQWPENLPKYIPGQNGVPPPQQIDLTADTLPIPMPVYSRALPFRSISMNTRPFQFMDMEQGLPSDFINSIFEDAKGYYWMGSTDGLIRYDGKSFLSYDLSPFIVQPNVSNMVEDKNGDLWMTLDYQSLGRFNGEQLIVYHYTSDFPGEYVKGIMEDRKGRIWLNLSNGIGRFHNGHLIRYATGQMDIDFNINQLIEDNDEVLWTINKAGISSFDLRAGFVQYPFSIDYINVNYRLIMDGEGILWLANGIYLCRFSMENLVFFTSPRLQEDLLIGLNIEQNGTIWGVHASSAISNFDGEQFTFYGTNQVFPDVRALTKVSLVDTEGRVWANTNGYGIQRISPKVIQHTNFEGVSKNADISAIAEDSTQHVWFGTHGNNGAIKYDGITYTLFRYFKQDENNPGAVIRSLYADGRGNIWMGAIKGGRSLGGLYKWDGNHLLWFTQNEGLPDNDVFAITEDQDGAIWFGSGTGILTKYDGSSFTKYPGTGTIRALITDQQGTIWAGTAGAGLRKFDGTYTTFFTQNEGLSSNSIVSLLEDQNGNIWAGSPDKGLNLFNREKETFTTYTTEDGLSSNDIWTITADRAGNIWVGAGDCLNLLVQDQEKEGLSYKILDYCDADGLHGGEFYANATLLDKEGRIWWGNNKSVSMLPAGVYPIQKTPRVELTSVEIDQNPIDFHSLSERSRTGKAYWSEKERELGLTRMKFKEAVPFHNYPTDLELPHHLNSMGFRFSAFQYPRTDQVQFSYFMDGLDNAWSLASPEDRVDYRGLPPGTFTFKVKAAGIEQIWSEPFEYAFIIHPPWWRSSWAYLIWSALVGLVLFSFYRYKVNRKLEQQEARRVKELDVLKNRFYTNITHEFRTPLTVILGVAEQLADQRAWPISKKEFSRGISLIYRNGNNLLRLINQLLDLSKLDAGHLKLNMAQGDVITYLKYLTESFYSMAQDKHIHLTFFSEDKEVIMDFDEKKIQQIVYNLLSNAIKFTKKKGKIIFHVEKKMDAGNAKLHIKVIDTGIGIPPDQLSHIFDRFYQVDTSSTPKDEGTGIGLALTKELVDMMKGSIDVESTVGKGTVFHVLLPIFKDSAPGNFVFDWVPGWGTDKMANVKEGSSSKKVNSRIAGSPIILIIEDNRDIITYVESILENYVFYSAENGQKGIDKALALIPDIIITDVMMPEKNGFEVCEALKKDERTSHIPIILLTARATQEDRVEGLGYGADAYLAKPFHKEELKTRIAQLIAIRKKLQKKYSNLVKDSPQETAPTTTPGPEETFLEKLKEAVLVNLDDSEFGPAQLSDSVAIGQMQVYRKLKALTGKTPSQFIRSIRLEKGMKLLQTTEMTISEIAYEVGFSDPNYFSRTFQLKYKITPSDFRK
ncbi:hybrid sensor histidine kinase/response regulator transcription factor [Cyclobacterium xiamenense]|uniref:hybrid sensor histidine kinase/response regulator transcription factor n=1 Tax=Cyclobacterium xiamenense TaxID=1297121 RepID=UPI0015A59330|nr:hybrid sensor histidine kinase/response regulator transcription factor [Cyclobacterium xiamenense]